MFELDNKLFVFSFGMVSSIYLFASTLRNINYIYIEGSNNTQNNFIPLLFVNGTALTFSGITIYYFINKIDRF